jgi:peptide chain release factor 2
VISETNAIKAVLEPFAETERAVEDAGVFLDMADAEPDGHARDEALEEMRQAMERCARVADDLEIRILLNGRFDPNNAYLSLHAGAGGTESCDWADMLRRMYGYYAERHGFKMSVLDVQPGEEAGIKSVQLLIEGPYAYGHLKSERGVHRLVRISPYDANKRRHTSFAALDVSAELDDDIEVEILDKDLRVDTYRASGSGGQHVNKTDSAVRLVHLPTGIVVACQAERSQHSNRDKAMKMLKARLYEREQDKKRKEMEQFYGDKGDIAWGRQIRSYVLQPYTMVKDHRTGMETGNVQAVLDGDIDRFVDAWLRQEGGAS